MTMQITYQELKEFIETLTPEQLALPARQTPCLLG